MANTLYICNLATDLFEGLKNFLSLAEVSEEQLEGTRDQRGVVVHYKV